MIPTNSNLHYEVRQCTNTACRFRFPAAEGDERGAQCPKCGAATAVTHHRPEKRVTPANHATSGLQIDVLLDNIRSLYNVGSIFRTADGAGVQHLYLCGITATPEHPKLAKTALGAAREMDWSYHLNGLDTAAGLKKQGYQLWALEDTPSAEPLFESRIPAASRPVVLIVGNENIGVDPAIREICDRLFALPMLGIKDSLNVAVAFGIALYQLQFGRSYDDYQLSSGAIL